MDISLVVSTFIAGLFTFLAPCTLPLVPGYLIFISGASLKDLESIKASEVRRRIFFNGLAYVIGFSAVFIALGSLVGLFGIALAHYRTLVTRIAGVLVILFGLTMLNVIRLPFLSREFRFDTPRSGRRGVLYSCLLGAAFAFGWTPCIGPVLGSILLLASTSTTVLQGTFFLFVYSLGLAIPFLASAAALGSASRLIGRISKHLGIISKIGGVFVILLGIIIFTGKASLLVSWVYHLFRFLNYERLLDYL